MFTGARKFFLLKAVKKPHQVHNPQSSNLCSRFSETMIENTMPDFPKSDCPEVWLSCEICDSHQAKRITTPSPPEAELMMLTDLAAAALQGCFGNGSC